MTLDEFRELNENIDCDETPSQIEVFTLLSKLFPWNEKIVAIAGHDIIILDMQESDLSAVSIEDAKTLVAGGVSYDPDYEFYMYV